MLANIFRLVKSRRRLPALILAILCITLVQVLVIHSMQNYLSRKPKGIDPLSTETEGSTLHQGDGLVQNDPLQQQVDGQVSLAARYNSSGPSTSKSTKKMDINADVVDVKLDDPEHMENQHRAGVRIHEHHSDLGKDIKRDEEIKKQAVDVKDPSKLSSSSVEVYRNKDISPSLVKNTNLDTVISTVVKNMTLLHDQGDQRTNLNQQQQQKPLSVNLSTALWGTLRQLPLNRSSPVQLNKNIDINNNNNNNNNILNNNINSNTSSRNTIPPEHPGNPEQKVSVNKVTSRQEQFLKMTTSPPGGALGLCPLTPPALVGKIQIPRVKVLSIKRILANNTGLTAGGKWSPLNCTARSRVIIIIPYRDRWPHLLMWLDHYHPILRRQLVDYRVVVVEQYGNGTFNKGLIMNAAYREMRQRMDFDCVIFHDIDMLLENDNNMYLCSSQPRHLSPAVSKFDYKLPYDELVGGVLMFPLSHFEMVNGYSNNYWGWGGEDDDMTNRIFNKGLAHERPHKTIGRYTMISHQQRQYSVKFTRIEKLLNTSNGRQDQDGLNSANYTLLLMKDEPLFTYLLVRVPHWTYTKEMEEEDKVAELKKRRENRKKGPKVKTNPAHPLALIIIFYLIASGGFYLMFPEVCRRS
ncbi:uncharacterized protein LOC106181686 [Lingula anatina]|uniref:Uncharacterized protein LOC106181686 n=1 Tax=Lingula anatina TaxID=7574 RepID=A0A1S3KH95_LINAN|nr:uncharacterized protein LOC106181686 [Lingula anatina]|eukprot:XP_013421591.1 uncharacterized protein LOC106181686 [Lingula anatina]